MSVFLILRIRNIICKTFPGYVFSLREKQLEAHHSKLGFLGTGSERFKAKVQHEVKQEPVMLGKIELKEKKTEFYLGDNLSSEGLKSYVEETIKDRAAKIKASIYEL